MKRLRRTIEEQESKLKQIAKNIQQLPRTMYPEDKGFPQAPDWVILLG